MDAVEDGHGLGRVGPEGGGERGGDVVAPLPRRLGHRGPLPQGVLGLPEDLGRVAVEEAEVGQGEGRGAAGVEPVQRAHGLV